MASDYLSLSISFNSFRYVNRASQDSVQSFIDRVNERHFPVPGTHFNLSPVDGNYIAKRSNQLWQDLSDFNNYYQAPNTSVTSRGTRTGENQRTRFQLAELPAEATYNFIAFMKYVAMLLEYIRDDYWRNNWQAIYYGGCFA